METNSVFNRTSDWQNRATSKRDSDLLIMSMTTDRIGRHEVILPINQNYNKIRERKQASLIRFYTQKKLYEMRANRARIWRVLSTYQQAWCVKCLITLCNYKHDLYSYCARLIGWKRVYFSCNMSTKTKM